MDQNVITEKECKENLIALEEKNALLDREINQLQKEKYENNLEIRSMHKFLDAFRLKNII